MDTLEPHYGAARAARWSHGPEMALVGVASAPAVTIAVVLCPMTGTDHRLFWMRSAWWCHDFRQKIESCCDGGGCPSIADVARPAAQGDQHARN